MGVSLEGIQQDDYSPVVWAIMERVATEATKIDSSTDAVRFGTAQGDTIYCFTRTTKVSPNVVSFEVCRGPRWVQFIVQDDGRVTERKMRSGPFMPQEAPVEGWTPTELLAAWPTTKNKTPRMPAMQALVRMALGLPTVLADKAA